jgi:hypothetical protein
VTGCEHQYLNRSHILAFPTNGGHAGYIG